MILWQQIKLKLLWHDYGHDDIATYNKEIEGYQKVYINKDQYKYNIAVICIFKADVILHG